MLLIQLKAPDSSIFSHASSIKVPHGTLPSSSVLKVTNDGTPQILNVNNNLCIFIQKIDRLF
eukprot:UN14079